MPGQPVVARDIMVTKLQTLRPDVELFEAIETLLRSQIFGAPVVDGHGRYLGDFSERDAIRLLLATAYDDVPANTIEAYVNSDAPTIDPETDLLTIAQTFLGTTVRRLPVLDRGRLVGQVSRRDLLTASQRLLEMGRSESSSVLYLSGTSDETDSAILVGGRG